MSLNSLDEMIRRLGIDPPEIGAKSERTKEALDAEVALEQCLNLNVSVETEAKAIDADEGKIAAEPNLSENDTDLRAASRAPSSPSPVVTVESAAERRGRTYEPTRRSRAPSPGAYEVLGPVPAGERCTLCGSGRDVHRIKYAGEVRLWHFFCADRYLEAIADPPPAKDQSESSGELPLAPQMPASPEPADQLPVEPKRLANGQVMWRFTAGPVTDASPLALMTRARSHDVVLTRDGPSLIVSAWHEVPSDLLRGLQRHAGTILVRLSRESEERIGRFQRGEDGLVTEILGFDPKGDD